MLIGRTEPRLLLPVPKWEWREPSLAQPKDQFGNQNRTVFRLELWKREGGLVDLQWFDDRDEFDYAVYRALIEEPHPHLVPLWAAVATLTTTSASNQNWPVPSDWNSSDNLAEVIASGASGGVRKGADNSNTSALASGGGAGAYSAQPNISLTPGGTAQYRLSAGGASVAKTSGAGNVTGNAGPDAWFNGSTLAASSVAAKGGLPGAGASGANTAAGGLGGDSASGIGSTKFSGGRGGDAVSGSSTSRVTATGGGGAAGETGDGNNGGDLTNSTSASSGGAGNGANSGGGSSGVASSNSTNPTSSAGGDYGGGSGGACSYRAAAGSADPTSGPGSQGLIRITYTPALASSSNSFFAFF